LENIIRKYAYMDPSTHDCRLLASRLNIIHNKRKGKKSSYSSMPRDSNDDDDDDDDDDTEIMRSMSAKAHRIIDHSLHLLTQIEISHIEHRVNEKHLLSSTMNQRKALGRTRSFIYDTRAFSSIPFYAIIPSCFNYHDIESDCHHLTRDLNAPSFSSSSSSSSSSWVMYRDQLCRVNNQPPRRYYINTRTGDIQEGEPFDVFIKNNVRQSLRIENW